MDLIQYKDNICRICLEDDVCLDWNRSINQFHDITYKDCYYKYSQLEQLATDPFPQMLCQNCCNALTSTHALILKVLESYKVLQKTIGLNSQYQELKTSTSTDNSVDDSQCSYVEFETVLTEMEEAEVVLDNKFKYDKSSDDDDVSFGCNVKIKVKKQSKVPPEVCENVKNKIKTKSVRLKEKFEESLKEPLDNTLEINASPTKSRNMSKVKRPRTVNDNKGEIIIEKEISGEYLTLDCNLIEYDVIDDKKPEEQKEVTNYEAKVQTKRKKVQVMCSFCSKILNSRRSLRLHEETHTENRERKMTCQICDLKFYTKTTLATHMDIHKENREKRHKCEFCNKAYYNKGALNVHRRIHLGQMMTCSLCSKNVYRQVDLEKHMRTAHSVTAINSEMKTRSKYAVRCPHCDKTIRTKSFKTHIAAHLNEPLLKCSICDKEYFSWKSCKLHIKKIHQKNSEECNNFIVKYPKNNRIHLEQLKAERIKTD